MKLDCEHTPALNSDTQNLYLGGRMCVRGKAIKRTIVNGLNHIKTSHYVTSPNNRERATANLKQNLRWQEQREGARQAS